MLANFKESLYRQIDYNPFMKRAQVTIFAVLGIIVVAAVALLYFYGRLSMPSIAQEKTVATLLPDFAESGNAIEGCLGKILYDGVSELGLKGGYMDNSGMKKYDYAGLGVTYLYFSGESLVPQKAEMEKSLSEYMKANSAQCIKAGEETGIEIEQGDIKDAKVYISESKVTAEVEWQLTFRKDALVSRLDMLNAEAPVKLGKIVNEITGFMAVQLEKPEEICLSCLIDAGERNNFQIDIDNMITTYVFNVKDKNTEEGYDFVFANGY